MTDRFRALELDVDLVSSEVRRRGELLPLPPRAVEILAVLSKHPGELVTRDEIRTAVWNGAHVDLDRSVNLYISLLRKAFGDDARSPRYIETVPRKGYRFVAPVEEERRRIRILVLPFDCIGPGDDEYLSRGMTDELILQLGRLGHEGVEVLVRDSNSPDSGLDASHIVAGSVRKSGDEVRIGVRLIRAEDDAVAWADAFQETNAGVLTLPSRVARAIASEIRIQLSPAAHPKDGAVVPQNAYDLYLKGRHLFFSPRHAPNRRALEFLERSIELAPEFAPARWLLTEALLVAASNSSVDPETIRPAIREHAERALELNPDSPEAWASRAFKRAMLDWDWAGVEADVSRARTLGQSADALRLCGMVWLMMRRFDEALIWLSRAVELDPLSLHTSFVAGWAFHRARRYPEAIERLERTVAVDPSGPTGSVFLADCHLHEGNVERARELCVKRLETASGPPMVFGYAASIFARSGCELEARTLVSRLQSSSESNFVDPYYLASAHAGLEETDVALEYLSRAARQRSLVMAIARFDSFLDPLRSDARFDALMEELGLP